MRQSVGSGMAAFRFSPLLLNGPPGIGKSIWGREINDFFRLQQHSRCQPLNLLLWNIGVESAMSSRSGSRRRQTNFYS